MTPVDLGSYKSIYLQTAKEYVNSLSENVNKLVNNILDKEAMNQIHISSHSLKSQSQVMGYNDIAQLSKSLEEISNNALSANNPLTNDVIVDMKKSINELEEMLKPHNARTSRGKQVQDDTV